MQKGDDDRRHPVGFYSTTLTSAERNYDIYNLELLAIVKSLQHWCLLLARSPHKIKVFSDHMNLQYWCKGVHSLMPDLGRCYLVTDLLQLRFRVPPEV